MPPANPPIKKPADATKKRPRKPAARRKSKTAAPYSVESVGLDAFLYVPGRLVPAVVQILTVTVLTYWFTVEEIGGYDLAFRFVLFLSTFTFMWVNMAVLRFYAPYEAREARVFAPVTGLIRYGATGLGVVITVVVYATGMAKPLGVPGELLLPGLAVFIGYSFYECGLAVLRAKHRPITYSVATTLNAGLRLPLAIGCFVWLHMGVEGMLWSMAATYLLAHVLILARHLGWPGALETQERKKLFRDILDYGLPIWLTQVLNFFLINLDRWLINLLGTTAENGLAGVGLYSVATTLVDQPVTLVFQTFTLAVFPSVVALWEKHGKEATEDLLKGLTRLYFLLCLPLVVFFTMLANPIFQVLAHGEARTAYSASGWIATASFFYGLSYFASFGLHVSKRTKLLLAATVFALLINVAANAFLIPREGFLGAAQARLISNFVLTAAVAAAGHRFLRWRLPLISFLRIFAAALAAGGAAWLLAYFVAVNVVSLALILSAAALLYFLFLLFLRELTSQGVAESASQVLTRLRGTKDRGRRDSRDNRTR
ncbi:MAG: lipopolysaccharide biosynthesis protein [Candidatus Hydrogenedentes bacterium]|nr:lipopolysaccharide biosynthesis protein [Candidatus Hydrogenedentota bacterium]